MKQYLSMLLFDRKNLRFGDFVRLQQLQAQLGALEFDGVGDERHRLELMRQYNAPPLVCQRRPPPGTFPPRHSSAPPGTDCGNSGRARTPLTTPCPALLFSPPAGGQGRTGFRVARSGMTRELLL